MFLSPDDVKAGTYVNFNVDDSYLGPAIRETQDVWLQSIIGTALYNRLRELVYNAITEAEDNIDDEVNAIYKTLLDDYCIPYLEHKVQAVLVLMASYQTRNLGVIHPSDENLNAQQLSDVLKIQQRYNAVSDRYATALSQFLCQWRKSFPELNSNHCNCGAYKPQIGKTFIHTGLWLGNGDTNCCD